MAAYTYEQALKRGLALDLGNWGMVDPYIYRGVGIKYPYGSGTTSASEVSPYSKTTYAIRGDVRSTKNYNEWLIEQAGGRGTPQPESFWQSQIDLATQLAGRAQNTGYSFYEYLNRPGGGRNPQVLEKIKELSTKELKTVKEETGRQTGELRAASRRIKRARGGLVAKAVAPGMGPEATKLPALGEQGLGLISNMLGEELKI